MALNIKLDDKQFQELRRQHAEQIQATKDLSDNLSKWLALLVAALGNEGGDEGIQQQVDQLTEELKSSTDTVEAAINQQSKGA